jgi:hypothetical protein
MYDKGLKKSCHKEKESVARYAAQQNPGTS